jgi:hypothetical protein
MHDLDERIIEDEKEDDTDEQRNVFDGEFCVKEFAGKRSIRWYLTYPNCCLEKEKYKNLICSNMLARNNGVKDYLIARELHLAGNYHLHVFLRLEKKVRWTSNFFDVLFEGKVIHGNYQTCRNWRDVVGYIMKGGDYITSLSHRCLLRCRDRNIDTKTKNLKLLNENICDLIDAGIVSLYSLPSLIKGRDLYKLYQSRDNQIRDCKCYWLYGDAGVGKSYVVRHVYPSIFSKPRDIWWNGYINQRQVLFEDFDHSHVKILGSCLKEWADQYLFEAPVKGGFCLPDYDVFIVTSNYSIDQLFTFEDDAELNEAITRRFKIRKYVSREDFDLIVKWLQNIPDENENGKIE